MTNFISDTINPSINFWEVNPQLKFISDFKVLYDKDNSKDKEYSSKQMWAIVMYADPSKSIIYRMPEEERKNEILETILTDKHKWEDILPCLESYPKLCLSKKQRVFKSWGDKLDEFENFIGKQKINMGNWDDLAKMQKSFLDLFKIYSTIEEELSEEENKGRLKGDRKETLSEKGII